MKAVFEVLLKNIKSGKEAPVNFPLNDMVSNKYRDAYFNGSYEVLGVSSLNPTYDSLADSLIGLSVRELENISQQLGKIASYEDGSDIAVQYLFENFSHSVSNILYQNLWVYVQVFEDKNLFDLGKKISNLIKDKTISIPDNDIFDLLSNYEKLADHFIQNGYLVEFNGFYILKEI